MYLSKSVIILATGASLASAINFANYGNMAMEAIKRSLPEMETIYPRQNATTCPAVWTTIASELQTLFLNTTDSLCNDDARAAIRLAFHDCGSWNLTSPGGCDGSIILAPEELQRNENRNMTVIGAKLLAITQKYQAIDSSVGAADMIQFAASVAITTCPLGPRVKTLVGRPDSSVPNIEGLLPDVHSPSTDIIALFAAKGITAAEMIALIGAHTSSKQFFVNEANAGAPQDDTPGTWDVDFYANTVATEPPSGVEVFASDASLAADPVTSATFKGFVGRQGRWNGAFVNAMSHLSLLGVPGGAANLIDCTAAVPNTRTVPRDVKNAPINGRI